MTRLIRPTDIRPDAHRDVGDEIRFHLEMRTREFIAEGLSPDEARRAAQASFGDVGAITRAVERERAVRDRERARRDWWRGTALDLRHAWRALKGRPLFTAATVLTLALGTGATVAIFTVVNGVLVRPLPYAAPDRLAMIWFRGDGVRANERWPLSAGFFTDLTAESHAFALAAAFRSWPQTLRDGDVVEQLHGARVTPSLFPTLGVRPLLGRVLETRDTLSSAPRVALISYGLWRRRYGGAANVVGRSALVSDVPTTIVGVMPPGFAFPRGAEFPPGLQFPLRTDIWTPLSFTAQDAANYGTMNIAAVTRLRDGLTPAAARRETGEAMGRIVRRIGFPFPLGVTLLTMQEQSSEAVRRGLLVVMAGVVVVLLVACFNVATLLVARTAERTRELAVRAALGARRGRVTRQLITENLLLAAAGSALGAGVAAWGVRALLALVPGTLPRADDVRMDWRVLALSAALSITLGVAFGAVSTLASGRTNLLDALQGGGPRTSPGRRSRLGRRLLVTAEVAMSLVLLIAAGLLVTSFVRLQRVRSGFEPRGAVTAAVSLPVGDHFDPVHDGPAWARFFTSLNERLGAAPGIEAVGGVSALPLSGSVESGAFAIEGQPAPEPGKAPQTQYSVVSGDYFRAAGMRLRQGRFLSAEDRGDGPRTAVVSATFAAKYFPHESAIGRRIRTVFDFQPGAREIVGVVDDVKLTSLAAEEVPAVYVPETQMTYPFLVLVVRSRLATDATIAVMRRELRAVNPGVALTDVRTLEEVYRTSLARQRFSLVLIGAFAGSALVLSLLGLYGIIALGVQQRRRELGVRLALGARPRDLRRLVLREGVLMTVAGVAAGLGMASAVTRTLGDLLYQTDATSGGIFALCAVAVATTALGASYLPARRATRVEPSVTLRSE